MSRKFEPEKFAKRVKEARKAAGLTYPALQARVAALTDDAKGSSYGNIYTYENSPPDHPRPNIVKAIAEATGERFDWLMWGTGPRNEAEELAGELIYGDNVPNPRWRDDEFGQVLVDALGGPVPALVRAGFAHHWRRVWMRVDRKRLDDFLVLSGDGELTLPMIAPELASRSPAAAMSAGDVIRALANALVSPLRELGVPWADMREEEKTDYVLAALPPIARQWERHLEWAEVQANTSTSYQEDNDA